MSDKLDESHIQGLANSQNMSSDGFVPNTPPYSENLQTGQSVNNAFRQTPPDMKRHWYAVRATQGRAKVTYEKLLSLPFDDIEPYLPTKKSRKTDISDFNKPREYVNEEPLIPSLLFLNCTRNRFREIIDLCIKGFTPYYNHFAINCYGSNEYLVIPDKQFNSFRRIVESEYGDTIVNQADAPDFIVGDRVRVIEGPYAGIEGIVMKYKHQRRVFVQLEGIGSFGTGYICKGYLEKIEDAD